MFQFPGLSPLRVSGLQPDGLPHSDIRGSQLVCNSPRLFAAYHVLRRLWEPRHSPYALICFLFLPKPPFLGLRCSFARSGISPDQQTYPSNALRLFAFAQTTQLVNELAEPFTTCRSTTKNAAHGNVQSLWTISPESNRLKSLLIQISIKTAITIGMTIQTDLYTLICGGGYRSRTDDLLLAKQAL